MDRSTIAYYCSLADGIEESFEGMEDAEKVTLALRAAQAEAPHASSLSKPGFVDYQLALGNRQAIEFAGEDSDIVSKINSDEIVRRMDIAALMNDLGGPNSKHSDFLETLLDILEADVLKTVPEDRKFEFECVLRMFKFRQLEAFRAAQHEGAFMVLFAKHLKQAGITIESPK